MDQQARYDAYRGHKITPFLFFSSSAVSPHLAALFLSVSFLVFSSRLLPSYCHLTTMLHASFESKPDSSPALGLEGLCRNIAAIGLNQSPPAAGSSLWRVSVLAQDMGGSLSSKFSGQASGKWSVSLSHILIFANARGLWRWGFEGPLYDQESLEERLKEREVDLVD